MKNVIKSLIELNQQYPKWIDLYPPADPNMIAATEKILQINIDDQLQEIYKITDGFGIVDYCLIGINNKRINNILHQNYPLIYNETFDSNVIDFVLTSGDETYQYINNVNRGHHNVLRTDDFESIVVADNIEEFLNKFLKNMRILLETIGDDDIVMYLDDERLEGKLIK